MIIVMIALLFLLLIAGLPVVISIGIPSLIYVILDQSIPTFVTIQRMVAGINAYSLLAIPFFILAGNLMNTGGITTRIFNSCSVSFGRLRGGLAHVNIISSIIFAGMSGAAIADAGGLGAIEIKAMRENKYDERMTIGITAASSIIGPIIPPSMPVVVYGVVASASIGRLFAAGLLPGIIMGISLMLLVFLLANKMNCPVGERTSMKAKWLAFRKAFFPLMTPVIILGGIFSGYFTPTEAAAIASLYALILGIIYREIDMVKFKEAVRSSMITTVQVLFIVAAAALFAWILAREQVPQKLVYMVQSFNISKWMVVFIFNLLLLIVGLFMETVASINLLVPVLLPVMIALGMDPIQFGIVMILNLVIGTLTPPFGTVLFVLSGVANVSVETVARSTLIFLAPLILVLILINAIPPLTLWLPNLLYGLQ